ncbi:EmrB/QacA subfamily drug resistance transporter [Paenibacillus castaneae]|uniref:MDR family MFS transporter n=1 Tax=Paenibacillus castaneae TaxID=474957 RepID=UPI000C9AFB56|nr:MDR family MFS transporter [Paenibacillus castaneae]NIK80039.1 EmrB/QacA subfamily drug resistance transporter [Paenibacillus castaneae]
MNANQTRRKVTIALFVATFLAAIEGTIVSTAMPSITGELNGVQQYSWIISIYLLATVISTPVYGKLSDLYGRKRLFIIGAIIFLAGSMLSGLAQSMDQLIWFRALQGLGAGALTTIPYTVIGDLYPFEQRAKVQGWMSSIWGIAGISGPLMGGLLVDFISWRAIFYMNLPFGIAAIYLLSTSLREAFEKKKRHIDYPGIVTFSIGMFCFLYAMALLRDAGTGGSPNWLIALLFALAILFIVLFVGIERRSPEPIIPFELFRIRMISMANLVSFLLCVITVVIIFYLPLWIQGVYQKSATYSGLLMIPLSVAWPLGSILAGNWIAKKGLRYISVIGSCFLLISGFGFSLMTSSTSLVLFIIYVFMAGLSFGLSLTSLTVAVSSSVGWELRGSAVASNNFIRTLGQTIGITVFGLLLHTGEADKILPTELAASLHTIFIWIAMIAIVVLLLALGLPKLEQGEQQQRNAS